jgi:alcohol dehydrogenase (cytochrome c)
MRIPSLSLALALSFASTVIGQIQIAAPPAAARRAVQTVDGKTIEGQVMSEGMQELDLRTDDKQLHLLRKAAGDKYRVVTSQTDWTSYNGDMSGNRYTKMTPITKANVARLAPK